LIFAGSDAILYPMLKIRLQRTGKRGQAYFRLVVTEHTVKPKGEYLEYLGSYDPHKNGVKVDGERIGYWLSKGAKLSATANNLLVERGVVEGKKVMVWKPKKKEKSAETTEAKTPETATEKPKERPPKSEEVPTPEPGNEAPAEIPVEVPTQ
jgi:small subunit ribosomal protein S16